jgi:glycine hydroxymethyltransferase
MMRKTEKWFQALLREGAFMLDQDDPALGRMLEDELERQASTLVMVASCSVTDPSVLACEAMAAVNVTAEGYPGNRYHAGCAVIDQIEQLAIDRARTAFGARFANVQPHSATTANYVVMSCVLRPGDALLGMDLAAGGHLTHGSKVSISGQYYRSFGYGLDDRGRIDFDQVRRLAHEVQPKLIVCGATAHPRVIDFARFRAIADEVGAFLLADISHTAGLVAAGLHPSPIDHAHFTTTCTHKQLFGPRGGLIMMGVDHATPAPGGKRTLAEALQRAVFPGMQGAPNLNSIAAKARALGRLVEPEFAQLARRIRDTAAQLASALIERGYDVVSGGTDNHIVLVDLGPHGMTGWVAERALEDARIIVNKNRVPGDPRSAQTTSGIRFGTNTLARRLLGGAEIAACADLVDQVLRGVAVTGDQAYSLDDTLLSRIQREVEDLCRRFPIPGYAMPIASAIAQRAVS